MNFNILKSFTSSYPAILFPHANQGLVCKHRAAFCRNLNADWGERNTRWLICVNGFIFTSTCKIREISNFRADTALHCQRPSHARFFRRPLLQLLLARSPGNFHSESEVMIMGTKSEWWCLVQCTKDLIEISTATTSILSAPHNLPAKLAASDSTTADSGLSGRCRHRDFILRRLQFRE